MRPQHIVEEEQALRDLCARIHKVQAELDALREQYTDRQQALQHLNVPSPVPTALRPRSREEERMLKKLPGEYISPAKDVHGTRLFYRDTVRHRGGRGWYGRIIESRKLHDGSTVTLLYLTCTCDGRPYRKPIVKLVPTSELEHVYHVPLRAGAWPT